MGKYTKMSQQVLEKVGGLSNITFVERCAFITPANPRWMWKQSRALKMSWAW